LQQDFYKSARPFLINQALLIIFLDVIEMKRLLFYIFMKVYIHNPTISKFGKLDDTVYSLSVDTAKRALKGFDKDRIEFLIFTSFAPESYTKEFHLAAKLASALQLDQIFAIRTESASSSGASAVQIACRLIQSGAFKTGIVIGTEVMSRLNRQDSNEILGSVLSDTQNKYGMFMAHGGAMIANRYLYDYAYTRDELYSISKKVHDNGLNNPNAPSLATQWNGVKTQFFLYF
jgi:acetyl-CoA C-acetyltransferase